MNMEALQMIQTLQPFVVRLSRFLFFVAISLSWLTFHCNRACEVFRCGDYSLDYPFGAKSRGCGDPALQLECNNATRTPLISIGDFQYYIQESHNYSQQVAAYSYPTMIILYKQFKKDVCDLSESVYDQFWSDNQFHIVDGYTNITLAKDCTNYGEPYSPNLMCKDHSYYNVSLPGSVCVSDFRIAVNGTDLNLKSGEHLPQIIGEGVNIAWYASKYCDYPCYEADHINCTHLRTSSFCYCDMSYSQCSTVAGKSKKTVVLGAAIGSGVLFIGAILLVGFCRKRSIFMATLQRLIQKCHTRIANMIYNPLCSRFTATKCIFKTSW